MKTKEQLIAELQCAQKRIITVTKEANGGEVSAVSDYLIYAQHYVTKAIETLKSKR